MNSKIDFFTKLEELLEADPGTVKGEDRLESLGWSSLAVVGFIAMVDEEYGLAVSPARLAKCDTPNDLMALLGEQLSWAA